MDFCDLAKLIALLAKERKFVRETLIHNKKTLGRRVLTHLVFADCESISYYLKDCVNSDYEAKDYEGKIDTSDWLASCAEDYIINEDGSFSCRERKIRTLPHLLFVLNYTAKYIGKKFDPKEVAGWQHVKPAFKVRDRITHPKTLTDLKITDTDFQRIEALEEWFQDCIAFLMEKT